MDDIGAVNRFERSEGLVDKVLARSSGLTWIRSFLR
jgi:hypothetical protein